MMCEKCWGDAYFRHRFVDSSKGQAEHYRELLEERKDTPCSLDQQAGVEQIVGFLEVGQ